MENIAFDASKGDVLVTGGAGFVGRHLVQRLLNTGVRVTVVDPIVPLTGGIHPREWVTNPLIRWDPYSYTGFEFIQMDCRDFFKEDIAHGQYRQFAYAFHLAAMVGGRMMIDYNPLVVAEDLAIDSDYWAWARQVKPGKSIIFSSSAAYPVGYQTQGYHLDLKESDINLEGGIIGVPDASYGWAKLTIEMLSKLAYEKYGLPSIVYRPFSGYGPDQDMTYPFPSIMSRALNNDSISRFAVWGTGDQVRDFIHIEDCITGILSTCEAFNDGSPINLSTGVATSFKELASEACLVAGYRPEVYGLSDKPEGVFYRVGDRTLQESLGFIPSVSLRQGVCEAISLFQEHSIKA